MISGKLNTKEIVTGCFLSLLVIILTFPANDWSYSAGIDPPLAWVFNSLFQNGIGTGPVIIFPHGPLAFFNYPLEENILLVILVTAILKALLVFQLVSLLEDRNKYRKWIIVFITAYIIAVTAGFSHLLLACIILSYSCCFPSGNQGNKYFAIDSCCFLSGNGDKNNSSYSCCFLSGNRRVIIIALVLSAFAFYVKAYVAIISGILFISFQAYYLIKTKNARRLIIDSLLLAALILLFWLILFGGFGGFFRYVVGMFHLAQDNSSAAAFYPNNNWLVLSSFIILVISLFVINRTRESNFFGLLIALSLFAAWKHGMAREDIFHARGFWVFTLICLAVFSIFNKKKIVAGIVISITALFLLGLNMHYSVNYSFASFELFQADNFIGFVSNYPSIKTKADETTLKETAVNILPDRLRAQISDSKTDVYPWDYSIIPVNKLNWQHRVVIHSYASYTSWLDRQNAGHFNSPDAPDFLVWELDKITKDVNGGSFNSIDNRYLLNDEPQTMMEIIRNYDFADKESKFLLLKRRDHPVEMTSGDIPGGRYKWEEWIDVPAFKGDILRAKLTFNKTFLQRVKSFFYKDEQFWMYLKLPGGEIHKYRIVPENAEDGLWINPYIFNDEKAFTVSALQFRGSNQKILCDEISVSWERVSFKDDQNRALAVFNIDDDNSDSLVFSSLNDFEELNKAKSYSAGFAMQPDSIPFGDLKIVADCRVKAADYSLTNNISLVISVENEKGNLVWKGVSIDPQLIDEKGWNHIYNQVAYKHSSKGCRLKAYIWNQSDQQIRIDEFRVMIFDPGQWTIVNNYSQNLHIDL
jgi:hypothetical protein